MCGASDAKAIDAISHYSSIVRNAQVCFKCAEEVANAFNKAHSGQWLTWEKPKRITQKNKKAVIPPGLRSKVYERDAYQCQNCGIREKLTIDHIHPESKGGATELQNLQTLCMPCNLRKGATVTA